MAFPNGWTRRVKLTIDNTKVPGNETDWPCLIATPSLPSGIFDADGANPAINGGGDLRASSDQDGTTQLPLEVVSFVTNNNPALGTAELWVKIPSVSGSVDTDYWLWWGKAGESQPAEDSAFGKENVWDSDFLMVQHLEEDPNGAAPQAIDSTSNDIDGTEAGGIDTQSSGQIGQGWLLDGTATNDHIGFGDNAEFTAAQAWTLQCWFKPDAGGLTNFGPLLASQDSNWKGWICSFNGFSNVGEVLLGIGTDNSNRIIRRTSATVTSSVWAQFSGTYDGGGDVSTMHTYLDGSLSDGATIDVGTVTNPDYSVSQLRAGVRDGDSATWQFDGILDELRISTAERSANWIGADYNSQDSPGTFLSAGTPETPPSGAPPLVAIFRQIGL